MRHVLALNVRSLMEHHYRESANRPKALAKDAGLALSTVQRILSASNAVNLDYIEELALALHATPYQLLLPGLDAKNPQVVHGATEEEQRLYRRWQKKELIWEDG